MSPPRDAPPPDARHRLAVLAVLGLAALARGTAAARKSLVLDEFHTYHHATQPSLEELLRTLRLDNHPPLGMASVALSRALLGSDALALRAPALLFGLLELALLSWLASRALGRRAGLLAVALLAASSLHVDFSSQARMYALHSLAAGACLVAAHAVVSRERARWAPPVLAVALAAMFHTHYFGLHYAAGAGLAALAVAVRDPAARARLPRLALPALAALLVCLPWAVWGFRFQLGHALPPGGKDRSLAGLAESFVHLFFLNVRLGGPLLRPAFIGAGGLVLALGLAGGAALWQDARRRALAAFLIASAFAVPALAWLAANLAPRMGFTWHYVLPSAMPLALLAAAGASDPGTRWPRARRAAFALVLSLAVLLTGLNLATRGTEDFRGAVAHLLALHRHGDAVISVEWQPPLFPQGQPYDYYAPRLSPAPPPRLAMEGFTLADPRELDGRARALVLSKSLPGDQHLMELLRERFELVERRRFGFGLDVLVWERP